MKNISYFLIIMQLCLTNYISKMPKYFYVYVTYVSRNTGYNPWVHKCVSTSVNSWKIKSHLYDKIRLSCRYKWRAPYIPNVTSNSHENNSSFHIEKKYIFRIVTNAAFRTSLLSLPTLTKILALFILKRISSLVSWQMMYSVHPYRYSQLSRKC